MRFITFLGFCYCVTHILEITKIIEAGRQKKLNFQLTGAMSRRRSRRVPISQRLPTSLSLLGLITTSWILQALYLLHLLGFSASGVVWHEPAIIIIIILKWLLYATFLSALEARLH